MEPRIPDGAYCLFRPVPVATFPDSPVLVRYSGPANPDTGGQFTVKLYREGRGPNGEKTVLLKPLNETFEPLVLTPADEDDVRIIAEVIEVLGQT